MENGNSRTLKYTYLTNGFVVSTVNLGGRADLSTPGNYETMVFQSDDDGEIGNLIDLDSARYHNEEDALEGHEEMVEKWLLRG